MNDIVAGTRRSRLARIQTEIVMNALKSGRANLEIEEKIIVTKGDKILDVPLAKIGDKGLFTREIEQQLLDGEIDFAVHSYKDLPTELPEGLAIGAVLERESPGDVLIAEPGINIETLPPGARVGTSSLRRRAQLLHARPDVKPVDVRGNVNTRIEKFEAGEYDAILLAEAGVKRMGLTDRIGSRIPSDIWYHAVGQGAIAVEIREDDERMRELLRVLEHATTRCATDAERALLAGLEGGCQVPVGVRTGVSRGVLKLFGMVAALDGSPFITARIEGRVEDASELGMKLSDKLRAMGATEILDDIRLCENR